MIQHQEQHKGRKLQLHLNERRHQDIMCQTHLSVLRVSGLHNHMVALPGIRDNKACRRECWCQRKEITEYSERGKRKLKFSCMNQYKQCFCLPCMETISTSLPSFVPPP